MSYGFFVQMESYEVSPGQCWGRDYLASQNEFSVLWFQWTHFRQRNLCNYAYGAPGRV